MDQKQKWLDWAVELQALAQAGLFYSKDVYDIERFQRIREIAAEMLTGPSGLSMDRVLDLFCNETGYQTPKLDTRAAIIRNDRILLVQENNGLWSLPGGWVDVDLSIAENTIKEVREEAGLNVVPKQIIAIQDRKKHNPELSAYGICKVFVLCELLGGEFRENSETIASGYFCAEDLPPLAENKTTTAQIRMCFEAYHAEHWEPLFD